MSNECIQNLARALYLFLEIYSGAIRRFLEFQKLYKNNGIWLSWMGNIEYCQIKNWHSMMFYHINWICNAMRNLGSNTNI